MSGEKSVSPRRRFAAIRPDFGGQDAVCAVLSGLLLTVAFRPFAMSWVAWVALLPVGWTVLRTSRWGCVQVAVLCGVVHWVSSVWWVGKVTSAGMIALALYCALYFIPPLLIWRGWDRRCGWKGGRGVVGLLLVAAAWSGTEQVRATVLTGFPWNMLGVSQVDWTALIGIADLGGVVAVSFLVMAANVVCLAMVTGPLRERWAMGVTVAVLLAGACVYGSQREREQSSDIAGLKIGLVQPNIPLDEKWDMALIERIFRVLERQTLPLANANADLIVWPETVLPFFLTEDPRQLAFIYTLLSNGSPILAGSMHTEDRHAEPMEMMNSSLFFAGAGEARNASPTRYDKQHLVLVGEYVPWPDVLLPILQTFSPMQENVTPGEETVLFRLQEDPAESNPFSVLICFEDTMPYLARRAARKGATWLVNQTNDGWFDGTPGSRQHLANARFRCVENRMPMVRSTNTGATAAVDAAGRITDLLDDGAGNVVLQEGRLLVDVIPSDGVQTIYTRWGDVFGWSCTVLSFLGGVMVWLKGRRA